MAKIGRPRKYPQTWRSRLTGIEWMRLDPKAMPGQLEPLLANCTDTYNANRNAIERLRLALSDLYKADLDMKWNRYGISITPRRTKPAKPTGKLEDTATIVNWLSERGQ